MSSSVLGISITGLAAAQAGLVTTGQNITNVNTPGFHRQEAVQQSNLPFFMGAGYLGQGVHVATVRRAYSDFLEAQLRQSGTDAAYRDTFLSQARVIDNVLSDPATGLSPAVDAFFSGAAGVALHPSSSASRQAMLGGAELTASRLQSLNASYEQVRDSVNSSIEASVTSINSYARQIAALNHRIVVADASGQGQPPNDLLDHRDKLVQQLGAEIGISVLKDPGGQYNVFFGTGQALVVGSDVSELKAVRAQDDPRNVEVSYGAGGGAIRLDQGLLESGRIGGNLVFRREVLDATQNELGRIAIVFAASVNAQQARGQDMRGNPGTAIFSAPQVQVQNRVGNTSPTPAVTIADATALTTSDYRLTFTDALGGYTLKRLADDTIIADPAAEGLDITIAAGATTAGDTYLIQPTRYGAQNISVVMRDPARIAAAAPLTVTEGDPAAVPPLVNAGTGRISALQFDDVSAAVFNEVSIDFVSSASFDVTDVTTGVTLAAGQPYDPASGATLTFNGWTAELSGAPAAGDRFNLEDTIKATANGLNDGRNALAMQNLQSALLVGGIATIEGAYGAYIASVGNKTHEADISAQAQTQLYNETTQMQQAVAGVNLDEEAANLIRFQQAYQASGKALQVANSLFQLLLDMGR